MAEIARLISLLQSSNQHRSSQNPTGCAQSPTFSSSVIKNFTGVEEISKAAYTKPTDIPGSFIKALQYIDNGKPLPPKPSEPVGKTFKVDLNNVLSRINSVFPPGASHPAPTGQIKETANDIANDLAVANCKRILAASGDSAKLESI